MAKTSYYTMNGRLVGESTNGVMRNYTTDALGSVVATASNGVAENTYQYKPYGGVLAKTGLVTDPLFMWNGRNGCRAEQGGVNYYIRNRQVSTESTRWFTVDRYWPNELAYTYARCSPVYLIDLSGYGITSPLAIVTADLNPCITREPSVTSPNGSKDPGSYSEGYGKSESFFLKAYDERYFTCVFGYTAAGASLQGKSSIVQWILTDEVVVGNGKSPPPKTLPKIDTPGVMAKCKTNHGYPNPYHLGKQPYIPIDWWIYYGIDAPGVLNLSSQYPVDCYDIGKYVLGRSVPESFLPTVAHHFTKRNTYHTCCVCDASKVTDDPSTGGKYCHDWSVDLDIGPGPDWHITWGGT